MGQRGAILRELGVVAALAAVFVPMSLVRLVDADEGVYLINARMVLEGQLPFHDFHYPQMFLLPYLYAGWMGVAGIGWYSARVFSALLAVGLGWALYRHVAWLGGRRTWGAIAALVFVTSSLAFAWLPLVKTYAFGTLALFLAYGVTCRGPERWRWTLAGALVGLAIDTRLYVVAVVPVLALAAWRQPAPPGPAVSNRVGSPRMRTLGHFSLGLALALLPNLLFILPDPETFFFNVVGHHAIRSDAGLVGAIPQKIAALGTMLGLNGSYGATSLQFTLLALANLALGVSCAALRTPLPLSLQLAGVLLVVSLVPTPTYPQYFTMFLPFMVVAAAELVLAVARETGPGRLRRRLGAALALLVGLHVAIAPIDVWWFTVGGDIVPGVFTRANVKNWTIPAITRVGRAIDEAMPPEATTAISWWPGYFVETRARVIPELANPFTLWFTARLEPGERARRGLLSHADIARRIQQRAVPVVVLGNWVTPGVHGVYRDLIRTSGYSEVQRLGDTEIYRLPDGAR
ncbi:MAG: glycosyltransferase family 39 protein [Candidatus Rokubacteria bacterium]|nr:glycosyltransferase family 39 protein [Candidatus Rokubacteria bacterium]